MVEYCHSEFPIFRLRVCETRLSSVFAAHGPRRFPLVSPNIEEWDVFGFGFLMCQIHDLGRVANFTGGSNFGVLICGTSEPPESESAEWRARSGGSWGDGEIAFRNVTYSCRTARRAYLFFCWRSSAFRYVGRPTSRALL